MLSQINLSGNETIESATAMLNQNSSPTISQTTISENIAPQTAISNIASQITISNSILSKNHNVKGEVQNQIVDDATSQTTVANSII